MRPPARSGQHLGMTIRRMMGVVFFVGLGIVLVLELGEPDGHSRSRQMQCNSNLRQVGLGLAGYYNTNGCFPPQYLADASGKPMHSWRTLILPYIDYAEMYQTYNFNEPWNGPNNRMIADTPISIYRCPNHPDFLDGKGARTSYVMIVGPDTAAPGNGTIAKKDVPDGAPSTILVVEVNNAPFRWAEPRDLDFNAMSFQINDLSRPSISSEHPARRRRWRQESGANVLMMDGSVHFLGSNSNPTTVKALLTIRGGEVLDFEWPDF